MIVTLCGTTKFRAGFERANKDLTAAGIVVLSVGWFGHADNAHPDRAQKALLDALHFRKIDIAHAILVIDRDYTAPTEIWAGGWYGDPYIGESTEREIAWARLNNKREFYISQGGLLRLVETHGTRMDPPGGVAMRPARDTIPLRNSPPASVVGMGRGQTP